MGVANKSRSQTQPWNGWGVTTDPGKMMIGRIGFLDDAKIYRKISHLLGVFFCCPVSVSLN